MPVSAMRVCGEPGCGARCSGSHCAAHKRTADLAYDRRRGSASKRGYGRRWARLRTIVLARDPLCKIQALCGRGLDKPGDEGYLPAPSADADHIVPRRAGGEDTLENLQGGCHACHSWKTATQDSNFARRKPKQTNGVGGLKSSRSPAA